MKYLIYLPIASLAVVACAPRQQCCIEDNVVKQTYIHKYGVEVPGDQWVESGKDGQVVTALANGVKVTRSFEAGHLQGNTTYTFPHSETIEKIETYHQGNLTGEVIHFTTGVPKIEISYIGPNEQKIKYWFENSTPRAVEHLKDGLLVNAEYYNANHKLEAKVVEGSGARIIRDAYGLLVNSDKIEQGKITSSLVYYPNGAPKETIPYVNGIIEGQKKTFLPAGEPVTVENWVAGVQEGTTYVYQNGEKVSEVPYVAGHKEGVERRYRDGNTVVEEITWKNGIQHGPVYTYVEGATSSAWYFQGRQVNKATFEHLSKPK